MQSQFFKDLFESTRCGILTIDEGSRVTTANQLARTILNLKELPSAGAVCQEYLKEHPAIARMLLDSLRMENPPSRIEMEIKVPGKQRRVINGSVSHIRKPDGTRNGAVLLFKDLTL